MGPTQRNWQQRGQGESRGGSGPSYTRMGWSWRCSGRPRGSTPCAAGVQAVVHEAGGQGERVHTVTLNSLTKRVLGLSLQGVAPNRPTYRSRSLSRNFGWGMARVLDWP